MNLRNVSFYSGVLLFIVVFGLGLQYVVLDMQDSSHTFFSESSISYMDSLVSSVEINNFDNLTSRTSDELQEDTLFLSGEDEGESSSTDVLASLNFFKGIQQKIINPIKMVFNVPTFLLSLFGLNPEPFSFVTRTINLVIYIGLITMIFINLK